MSSFALGLLAALMAPFLMAVGFIVWDNHWLGSPFALNLCKCNLAAVGFAIVVFTNEDSDFSFTNVGFLILSSILGLLVGDWVWLEGMRVLGARKVIVMDTLKPFLAALLGRVFLHEHLSILAYLGLVLTAIGVVMVGLDMESESTTSSKDTELDATEDPAESDNLVRGERAHDKSLQHSTSYSEMRKKRKQPLRETYYGIFMAVLNVLLHTFGALLTKYFGVGMTTWEINLIRFGFSGVVMTIISVSFHFRAFLFSSQEVRLSIDRPWYALPRMNLSQWLHVLTGMVFVSFLAPALSNYAMFQIALALLLTLESLGPLYSLPLVFLLQGERPSARSGAGAVLAVLGIVLLSSRGMAF
ncbi:hypothetical protein FisN_21Hu121 [Fistulifera solaris]|uniref:EamA domain-containing protein n=1 Tax=Fistulifera solaris TaxID=1519565 RepID=A0A1Z5JSE5_FISSO|nr:hypothetical protein FisN_21Hu121 [Fistulifera solaris]|eukprot:GAX16681.1 hypothetical protein FisN_21Hu121 [Fistulifera solaris]